jgi:hypothetical protein
MNAVQYVTTGTEYPEQLQCLLLFQKEYVEILLFAIRSLELWSRIQKFKNRFGSEKQKSKSNSIRLGKIHRAST